MASTGTSLQRGRTSYYSRGSTRTATYQGGSGTHMVGSQGGQLRYQAPSGQQVAVNRPSLPSKTYHRIVLAEFAVCVVLIGVQPLLLPRKQSAEGDTEAIAETVTLAGPLVRLTAVCIVFFVLALMAGGERTGKVAAAFGGLITVGTLLNAADLFTTLGKMFTPGTAASSSASGSLSTGANATSLDSGLENALGGQPPTPSGLSNPPGTSGNPIGEG